METTELNQAYIDKFFGTSGYLEGMSNAAIKRAISQLRQGWIASGDYIVGRDPTSQAIFKFVKR
jgi:hypothetical protein